MRAGDAAAADAGVECDAHASGVVVALGLRGQELERLSRTVDRDGCKPGKACIRAPAATRRASLQAAFKACRTAAASGSYFSCKAA